MATQALGQARDTVLRYGARAGEELLNAIVRAESVA